MNCNAFCFHKGGYEVCIPTKVIFERRVSDDRTFRVTKFYDGVCELYVVDNQCHDDYYINTFNNMAEAIKYTKILIELVSAD
jgi:ATP-dependent helicase YprA (DUF1998 family)